MPNPTLQSTAPRRLRRAPERPISLTERGRMVVLLGKLERQWPDLEPWQQRHITGLLSRLLATYGLQSEGGAS